MLLFWLPVSLLTFSDTAAEMGGQVWGAKTKQFFGGQKTMAGTLSFGVTSLAVSAGWLYAGFHLPVNDMIILTVLITLFCAAAELVTLHGWDNLTVLAVADCCFWHSAEFIPGQTFPGSAAAVSVSCIRQAPAGKYYADFPRKKPSAPGY